MPHARAHSDPCKPLVTSGHPPRARPQSPGPHDRRVSIDAQLEALLRIVFAGVAAGVIGLEREAHDKPAGVRTFAVVGIGGCVFTLALMQMFDGDASRAVGQIITGVGFLGAGTIMQVKDRVEGLTTAAGIWAVSAVGLSFGAGLYVLATGTTIILLIAFAVIGRIIPAAIKRDDSEAA
jgi:putative Mg2+ transporter-C (MgtC) family protein